MPSAQSLTRRGAAETNEHVDALNHAIQQLRRERGELGGQTSRVAAGEAVAVGDVVVTRRNDRTLRTGRDEPVRTRDRWTVTAVHRGGGITVSHEHGHGEVTLPPDYARRRRPGLAAANRRARTYSRRVTTRRCSGAARHRTRTRRTPPGRRRRCGRAAPGRRARPFVGPAAGTARPARSSGTAADS
jgi:hypothetical protein